MCTGARQVHSSRLSPPSLHSLLPSLPLLLLKKRGKLFITGIFPAKNLFFITVLNKFQKIAAGENYSHYSFILIQKQKGCNCNDFVKDGILAPPASSVLHPSLRFSSIPRFSSFVHTSPGLFSRFHTSPHFASLLLVSPHFFSFCNRRLLMLPIDVFRVCRLCFPLPVAYSRSCTLTVIENPLRHCFLRVFSLASCALRWSVGL